LDSKKGLIYSPKQIEEIEEDGKYFIGGIINSIKMFKSKKSGKEYFKLLLEDDEKQQYIMVWNAADLIGLFEGSFVIVYCNKSKFGYSKLREKEIVKL
jgi:hypothetical protein